MGHAHRNAYQCSGDDAEKHSSPDPGNDEDRGDDKARESQNHSLVTEISEGHGGSLAADDDTCGLEADEGDVESDSGSDRTLEVHRYRIHDEFPDIGDRQENEEDTLNEDGREGHLPGKSHSQAYGIYKECVQPHSGSKSERFAGIECHHHRADNGGEGSCGENRRSRHSLGGQGAEYAGIDGQDVGHREEGGKSGQNLGADAVLLYIEAECFSEKRCHGVKSE